MWRVPAQLPDRRAEGGQRGGLRSRDDQRSAAMAEGAIMRRPGTNVWQLRTGSVLWVGVTLNLTFFLDPFEQHGQFIFNQGEHIVCFL